VETCDSDTGLLPSSDAGCSSLDSIFKDHIYKDKNPRSSKYKYLAAAIKGAHFQGAWASPENQDVFGNEYYIALLTLGWGPDPLKNQWKRIDAGASETN
jgi:hypothetical protein